MSKLKLDPFNPEPKKHGKVVAKVASSLFVVSLMAGSGYFYWQYREAVKSNPLYETEQVAAAVRKLMDVPTSPLPTLATVTEKEKLQEQVFFKKAENGDKVLIYVAEGKAILYRPSIHKIIDVAPIKPTEPEVAGSTTTQPEESKSIAPAVPEKVSVSFYNGTTVTGITRTIERQLTQLTYDYIIGTRENAVDSTYEETIVIDLSGGQLKSQAAELAKILAARVGDLPQNEKDPGTNGLLVIVGTTSVPEPETSPQPEVSE